EFLPTQGDIRFREFESAVQAREDLNDSEKDALIQDRLESTQTVSESFSINLPNISKKNSTSPLMQYTVDNITMSYNYNTASGSSPDITKRENWATNASIAYGLSFRNVKLVRPFRFMEEVPVAGALSEIRLGVMPSSVNMSLSGSRSYGETRRRQLSNAADAIQFALQQTHTFNYNTSFGLNYNLTPGIPLSYSSNSAYDIGQQALRSANLTGADSLAYEPIPTFDVIKDMVSDTLSPRRNSFSESYSAAWLPPINR
ncbi:MAG TPA: cell surface protein SprA, partial [Bacteroidetes bacterium]|nr:cell surface protein SprA [Bacteroidota bacterium]